MTKYNNGDQVRYKPVGGPDSKTPDSTGTIKSVLTSPGQQASRNVQASEEAPRYEASRDCDLQGRMDADGEHCRLRIATPGRRPPSTRATFWGLRTDGYGRGSFGMVFGDVQRRGHLKIQLGFVNVAPFDLDV
ncbi:hypothetical protein B0T11DRAFT_279767 [Plectosphaerella cucumerina]|uniref:Hypervirulence associated protein TUDOR domain-containing protein n=1 Tax=Plectosphaerella cucumerina TaxID=40658 RepID=A0A8K0TFN4_9PEZI|nr:hypothetical protein B0T11DRAFT_279767 [Plectosphaerella cucumerina]